MLTGAWLHLLVGLPFLNGGRTVPHFQYTLHSTVLSTVCVTIKTEFLLPPSGSYQLHFLRHFQIPLAEALVRCQYLANSDQVLGDEISAQKYYNLIYFCPYAMNALLYCVLPNSIKCPRWNCLSKNGVRWNSVRWNDFYKLAFDVTAFDYLSVTRVKHNTYNGHKWGCTQNFV